MPSSTCWPAAVSRHRMTRSRSSANQSARPAMDHTPVLLIQPPRFVDVATSGLSVTTWSATSGCARCRSDRNRPSAACVEVVALGAYPSSAGTAGTGCVSTASRRRRSAAAARASAAGVPSSNFCQGSSGSMPEAAASSPICAPVSWAAWLPGWPSVARPRPLIVYAKMTVGRVSSMRPNASTSWARSWPARSRTISARSASVCGSSRPTRVSRSAPSRPARRRSRTSSGWERSRRWYSSLGMSRMRRSKTSPPSAAKSALIRWPQVRVMTCQSAAANMPCRRWIWTSGMTRSRDCRLRSTIQTTSPRLRTSGSMMASQTAPSSSSASPSRE